MANARTPFTNRAGEAVAGVLGQEESDEDAQGRRDQGRYGDDLHRPEQGRCDTGRFIAEDEFEADRADPAGDDGVDDDSQDGDRGDRGGGRGVFGELAEDLSPAEVAARRQRGGRIGNGAAHRAAPPLL